MSFEQRPFLTIPIPDARPARFTLDWPMTSKQFDHLMHVLNTMRPGLVEDPDGPPAEGQEQEAPQELAPGPQ